jgi:hypothetical protein
MKYIVLGDPHIDEASIDECDRIFNSINVLLQERKKNKESITLICLGDYYDKNRPTSSEIDLGTKWAVEFRKNVDRYVMIIGNHCEVTKKENCVSYLRHLDIEVLDDAIIDGMYFGHFMTDVSRKSFGEYDKDRKIEDIKHKFVFLGHQHDFQELYKGKKFHLGSMRYTSFGEDESLGKKLAVVDLDNEKISFRKISCIAIKNVSSVVELGEIEDKNIKVRITYNTFEQYKKEAFLIENYKNTFEDLIVKHNYIKTKNSNEPKEVLTSINDVNILRDDWIKGIEDCEVREEFAIITKKLVNAK